MQPADNSDVIIVGAGLVGASLALALGQAGLSVTLVESAPALPPTEDWDSRVYAISPASSAFLDSLGVWGGLDHTRIQQIARMEIFGDRSGSRLEFSAYDAGIAALAYIVESGRLAHALWVAVGDLENLRCLAPAVCESLTINEHGVTLALAGGPALSAQLIVGADGARSWVRRKAGLTARAASYGQLGVVANFATTRPHHGAAFQWFRADGVLAYLPLPGDRMSMVWSTPEANGKVLAALPPEALCAEVASAGKGTLGDLRLITAPQAFPLQRLTAERMIASHVALVGDAAHVVHPLAGQGVNLGFGDARVLATALATREPFRGCGDRTVLRRYERGRAEAILAMRTATDGLAALFGLQSTFAAELRNLGLNLTNRTAVLKNLLIRQATA